MELRDNVENSGNKKDRDHNIKSVYAKHADAFAEKTSMHGIKSVIKGKWCTCWHALWFLIVVGSFTGATYQIVMQTQKFASQPYRTVVNVIDEGFTFPDITVCDHLALPLNGVKPLREEISNSIETPVNSNSSNAEKKAYYTKMENLAKKVLSLAKENYNGSRKEVPIVNARQHFSYIKFGYPWPIDKILYCSYKDKPCNYSNFDVTFNKNRKNCYKFILKDEDRKPGHGNALDHSFYLLFLSPKLGNKFSWSKSKDYITLLQGAPVILNIKQAGIIETRQTVINCPAGVATNVQLYQRNIEFVENHPEKICMPPIKLKVFDTIERKYFYYKRRTVLCKKKLFNDYIYRKCNCLPEEPIVVLTNDKKTKAAIEREQFCTNMNKFLIQGANENHSSPISYWQRLKRNEITWKQLQEDLDKSSGRKGFMDSLMCYWRAVEEVEYGDLPYNMNCHETCRIKHYQQTVTQNPWPISTNFKRVGAKSQMELIAKFLLHYRNITKEIEAGYQNSNLLLTDLFYAHNYTSITGALSSCVKETFNETMCSHLANILRDNTVQITVTPQVDTAVEFKEEVYYLFWDWLSDIGGTLGLWIGCSIVTLIECGEFMGKIFSLTCVQVAQVAKGKKSTRRQDNQSNGERATDNIAYLHTENETENTGQSSNWI